MAISEKQLPKIEELEKQLAAFQAQIEELKAAAKAVTPDPETQTVNIKVEEAKVAETAQTAISAQTADNAKNAETADVAKSAASAETAQSAKTAVSAQTAEVANKAAALSVNELVFANGTKLWIE